MDAQQFETLQKQLETLNEKLQVIERAVIGEERTGQIGLVKRVWHLEQWQMNVNLRIATMSGVATGGVLLLKYLITKTI